MDNMWLKKFFKADSKTNIQSQEEIKEDNKTNATNTDNRLVITICRQMGSGGRKVAKKVAEKLNYDYYDKEIITKAAKHSGIDEELFKQVDDANLDSFWYEFSTSAYEGNKEESYKEMTAADKLFMIQSDAIRNIAKSGNAVIVGRCATYILKNRSKRIFICANDDERIARIKRAYKVDDEKAKKIMRASDEKRKWYHEYYTNQDWMNKSNYDLYINTSEIGVDKAVEMIVNLVTKK